MILKHRDRELLRFEWIDPQGVRVLSVNEAELRFLPLEMRGVSTDEALWKWLTHRTVPKHRHYIQAMLGNLGITRMSTQAIIEMCKGLSLNDVYWVTPDSFKGEWKDNNLYSNEFSKTLAVIVDAAPIFDNGYGLFSLAMYRPGQKYDEYDDLREFINHVAPALYESWLDFPKELTIEMANRLKLLKGFRFKRHKYYNLPVDRLSKIEDFLQIRVSQITEFGKRADELLRISKNDDSVNPVKSESTALQIKENLKADPFITYEELADILQMSQSSIARKMKDLKVAGEIRRVGADKNGYWEVV